MPSAASAKLEKQVSTEASEPFRQALVVVEHKIRNLEKRKRKIESYQEEQKNGKTLNSDQLSAVAKFDEVMCTLENLRDLHKQFSTIATEQTKLQKKLARKDALERAQQDIAKIKEILIVQDVLQNMGQDNVREDFLAGRNGAMQLTEDDLKYLDDLYLEISLKRGSEEGLPPFEEQLQQCAEHLLSIVDGKAKDIVGTTYAKLKELIGAIQSCGYFDHVAEVTAGEPDDSKQEPPGESFGDRMPEDCINANHEINQPQHADTPTLPSRKRQLQEVDSFITKVRKIKLVIAPPQSQNEFDIFGRSVAAQQFIQNYITDKCLQHLSSPPSACIPSQTP